MRRAVTFGDSDPVVAAIVRAAAIHALRSSTRFVGSAFTHAEGNAQQLAATYAQ